MDVNQKSTDNVAIQMQLIKLQIKLREWNILVASGCTPGGSEFHDDPKRCAKYFKEIASSKHKAMKERVKERRRADAAESRCIELEKKLKESKA